MFTDVQHWFKSVNPRVTVNYFHKIHYYVLYSNQLHPNLGIQLLFWYKSRSNIKKGQISVVFSFDK